MEKEQERGKKIRDDHLIKMQALDAKIQNAEYKTAKTHLSLTISKWCDCAGI